MAAPVQFGLWEKEEHPLPLGGAGDVMKNMEVRSVVTHLQGASKKRRFDSGHFHHRGCCVAPGPPISIWCRAGSCLAERQNPAGASRNNDAADSLGGEAGRKEY